MKFEHILVPIDNSEHSAPAVQAAIALSGCQGGKVTLLHCHDRIPNLIGGEAREDLEVELIEDDAEVLKPYAEILEQAGLMARLLVRGGDPGELIALEAETGGYDVIVMGTQGHGRIGGFLLGSVVNKVMSSTGCPVLVVH